MAENENTSNLDALIGRARTTLTLALTPREDGANKEIAIEDPVAREKTVNKAIEVFETALRKASVEGGSSLPPEYADQLILEVYGEQRHAESKGEVWNGILTTDKVSLVDAIKKASAPEAVISPEEQDKNKGWTTGHTLGTAAIGGGLLTAATAFTGKSDPEKGQKKWGFARVTGTVLFAAVTVAAIAGLARGDKNLDLWKRTLDGLNFRRGGAPGIA